MPDQNEEKLNLIIQTTKTGAPKYANTFNFTHQQDGTTLLRFYYAPPAGYDYIEASACLCVPTALALNLASKIADSAKQKQDALMSQKGKKVN